MVTLATETPRVELGDIAVSLGQHPGGKGSVSLACRLMAPVTLPASVCISVASVTQRCALETNRTFSACVPLPYVSGSWEVHCDAVESTLDETKNYRHLGVSWASFIVERAGLGEVT